MRFWDALETCVVMVMGVTSAYFVHAGKIARDWPDQAFSTVDCASFAAMQRLRLDEAFAYDEHFRNYRYGPSRRKAFRIVP